MYTPPHTVSNIHSTFQVIHIQFIPNNHGPTQIKTPKNKQAETVNRRIGQELVNIELQIFITTKT